MRRWIIVLSLLMLAVGVWAQAPGAVTFDSVCKLYREGNERDAFVLFLQFEGAEHLAARIGRGKPAEYLALLQEKGTGVPLPRRKLIEGDLLLTLGKREAALACYREVTAHIAANATDGWAQGMMPAEYYPVDPQQAFASRSEDYVIQVVQYPQEVMPFTLGPGSHRDNWLIRRFITLQAWEDAGKEFARIWAIHRKYTQPYTMITPVYHVETRSSSEETVTVQPAGFSGRALQFAIDYAYFFKRQGDAAGATSILMVPLLCMDMDRNPDHVGAPYGRGNRIFWFGASHGISRKEYLRLAYGELKSLGQEDALVTALQGQIDAKDNRARRVLARVRQLQGKLEEALALELAYLHQANFDPLTIAYRSGLAYETVEKPTDAVAQYEHALGLPYTPPHLPDADEEAVYAQQAQQMNLAGITALGTNPEQGRTHFQLEIINRLERLYGALNQSDKVLALSLRQYELNEGLLGDLGTLQATAARFTATGQGARFTAWATELLKTVTQPASRASLCWLLKDYAGAAQALGEMVRGKADTNSYDFYQWKQRFREVGSPQYRLLLEALIAANPKDSRTRLELLDLADRFEGPEVIPALEALLDSDASWAFARGKGNFSRTQFRNYYDLASRLMRLYEKAGAEDKLVALGFRVLEGQKPFTRPEQEAGLSTPHLEGQKPFTRPEQVAALPTPRADWNGFNEREIGLEDLLQAVYVMLPHVRTAADRERLRLLAEKSDCIPLKNQVARLLNGPNAVRLDPAGMHGHRYTNVSVRTLAGGTPALAGLLTNRDDVRALSADGQWVGTSWGLVRYHTGADGALEVLQIPLGGRVGDILSTPTGLFVSAATGIYRIDNPDSTLPAPVRLDPETPRVEDDKRLPRAEPLCWWKGMLWAPGWRIDPVKNEMQRFDQVEGPLFVAADRLWSRHGVYSEASGEFTQLPIEIEPSHWRLIGASAHEIWADVYVDDELRHRPALVDPATLAIRVLPIANVRTGEKLMVNGEFAIVTEDADHVWLMGDGGTLTVYDRNIGELRLVRQAESNKPVHLGPAVWQRNGYDGRFIHYYCGSATSEEVPGLTLHGDRGPTFRWQQHDGKLLLGSAIIREWREDNMGSDDNDGMSQHIQDLEGGLFAINPDTLAWEKLGTQTTELSDFYVKRIVFDDAAHCAYVCTNGGVTVLSLPDGTPVRRITVSDGLPSNKVEDVARIGNTLFFACELGDDRGGLATMDLTSGLLQTYTMADGLGMDKVKRLRVEGTKLHILYGTVYLRGRDELSHRWVRVKDQERVVTCPSSILDTLTWTFTDGTEFLPPATPPDDSKTLPYLGGAVLLDEVHGGKRYLGGTHGLLILDAEATVAGLPSPTQPIKLVRSRRQQWLADVEVRRPGRMSHDELARALQDDNPYYRAEALARQDFNTVNDYLDLLLPQLNSPEPRLRATAVYLLDKAKDDARVIPALKGLLADDDCDIRAFAVLALARHGVTPDATMLSALGDWEHSYHNFPFGATSSVGVEVTAESVYRALAPLATPAIFTLLLQHPIGGGYGTDEWHTRVFTALGASLRQHPEAADILLKAYDNNKQRGQIAFAQQIFTAAGKEMLPRLHEALASPDRVVRSNAARACGALGDPASIPVLLKALDLESGLSRASIVWALGELKASEAMPELVKLYIDARNDEQRHSGAGFRVAQAQAAMSAQYDAIGSVESIGADWSELNAAVTRTPLDPRDGEDLLTGRYILDAVRKIGNAAAQELYRTLAGQSDNEARAEAARVLADGTPDDRAKNLPILRHLLADTDFTIHLRAAVSLFLLNDGDRKPSILEALSSPNEWQRLSAAVELARVNDATRLTFARPRLEAIVNEREPGSYERQDVRRLLERIPKDNTR